MKKTQVWEIEDTISETISNELKSRVAPRAKPAASEFKSKPAPRTKPAASEFKSGAAPRTRIKPIAGEMKSQTAPPSKPVSNEMKFKFVPKSARLKKNPALAFSLSMLVPGAGQLYNKQWKRGSIFILLTAICLTSLLLTFTYWRQGVSSFFANNVSTFLTFMVCGVVYFAGIFFWLLNAVHAYFRTAGEREFRYRGTTLPFLPPLSSLLVPGWGQFLNGQVKKGGIFLAFTAAGFLAVPCLVIFPVIWPALITSTQRYIVEWIFAAALFMTPLVLFAWLLSVFDAFKVAADDIKKEPFRRRIEYTLNRIRIQGLYQGLVPHAKLTLGLSLMFAITLAAGYFLFPQDYYVDTLQRNRIRMAKQEMVLIPSLTSKILGYTPPEERNLEGWNPEEWELEGWNPEEWNTEGIKIPFELDI